MDKDFYDGNKGTRCPDKLFTKDVQKIKHAIDNAMENYERSVSPEEVEALFLSANPTLTTAQKSVFADMFEQLKQQQLMDKGIARDVMSTLFRQVVGEEVANLGFDFVNGDATTLEPLRNLLDTYADDFISPETITCPVVTITSQATLEFSSIAKNASKIASLI